MFPARGPGISVPKNIAFQAYRAIQTTQSSNAGQSNELLLQSADHPKLNFVAREDLNEATLDHLKHFVGIFDPESNTLELVEAKTVSVRSTLRSEDQDVQAQRMKVKTAGAEARRELGREFGTKKAKKAISQNADNKIMSPQKQRGLSPNSLRKANPAASAILDSMEASALDVPTKEAIEAEVQQSKPRPKHNPSAQTPQDAYSIDAVVGEDMMIALKVKPWVTAVEEGDGITVPSRFVVRRVKQLVEDDDIKKLKLLKYVLVLEEFLKQCVANGKAGVRIPKREVLRENLGEPDSVLDKLVERFTTNTKVTSWHAHLIRTTLAVLTLIIDDYETDTYDLREDLGMKPPEIAKYFAEVGARVRAPGEKRQKNMKWTKAEATLHGIAKLQVPLDFPKPRIMPRSRR